MGGTILGDSFFITAIVMISLPTACVAFDLFIISVISLIIGIGITKVSSTIGNKYHSIVIGLTVLLVLNLLCMLFTLLIKYSLAIFVIFLMEVTIILL